MNDTSGRCGRRMQALCTRSMSVSDDKQMLAKAETLIEAHPERAWSDERQRVAVLQRLLAADRAAA